MTSPTARVLIVACALASATSATAAEVESIDIEVGRPAHGVMVGIVDVPRPMVFAILLDCPSTAAWFPDLEDTRQIGPDRCAGRTDLPWPMADRTWEIDVTSTGVGTAHWETGFAYAAGSGNLAELRGSYVLEDLGDGRTRVTYEAWVDLGFWMPEPLVGWATRRVLPGILEGIEDHADTVLVAAL